MLRTIQSYVSLDGVVSGNVSSGYGFP